MRPFSVITAALLTACFAPALSYADGMPSARPGCHCLRPVRHVVRHARYRVRHARPMVAVAPPPLPEQPYNPLLPSTWDSDYDRAMVLHYRSPPVAGLYYQEPGFAATPDVAGIQPYRVPANGTVYQYDGMVGEYVQLSQWDAARALPPGPPPAAAAPPTPPSEARPTAMPVSLSPSGNAPVAPAPGSAGPAAPPPFPPTFPR
jgi:hypothetical protein